MKKTFFLTFTLIALLFNICSAQVSKVKTGDLLFAGIPLDYTIFDDTTEMSGAIAAATGNNGEINYIHVAILEVDAQYKTVLPVVGMKIGLKWDV